MREILFRGKRSCNNKWMIGSLFCWNDGDCFIVCDGIHHNHYKVDPETVGQFTGLTDKNGKKIFEGDVIRFHKFRDEPDWIGVVSYDICAYMAKGRMPLAYEKRIGQEPFYCPFEVSLSGIDKGTIKVIGNIYDNPELLEVE